MLKIESVLHFTIPVKELERSEKFYTGVLGLERIRRTGHMVFMRCGAFMSLMAQTGQSEAIHSPEECASKVLSRTVRVASSIAVVCTTASSC